MNKGDRITIVAGKEKEPAHTGITFTVENMDGDNVALKLADGTIYNGYTQGDLLAAPAGKAFAEPKVLNAVVDPKEKPKEAPVAFSFSSPQAIQAKQAEPTKGDVAKQEKKLTLAELDAEIAKDEKNEKNYTIDDYRDTAEMFIEGWEATLTFICRAFSKDTSDSAYEFPKAKKDKLIHQATKVSRKRGWVMPVEALFLGTLLPATAQIALKASDKRKEYFKTHKDEKPGTSADNSSEKKPSGRRPGRPSK